MLLKSPMMDGVGDGDAPNEKVDVGDADAVAVGVIDGLAPIESDAVGVSVIDGVPLGDGDEVGVADDDGVSDGVAEDDGETDGLAPTESVPVGDAVDDGVLLELGVPDGVRVDDNDDEGVIDDDGVIDGVRDDVGVGVAVRSRDRVDDGVELGVQELVGLAEEATDCARSEKIAPASPVTRKYNVRSVAPVARKKSALLSTGMSASEPREAAALANVA